MAAYAQSVLCARKDLANQQIVIRVSSKINMDKRPANPAQPVTTADLIQIMGTNLLRSSVQSGIFAKQVLQIMSRIDVQVALILRQLVLNQLRIALLVTQEVIVQVQETQTLLIENVQRVTTAHKVQRHLLHSHTNVLLVTTALLVKPRSWIVYRVNIAKLKD